MAFPESFLQDLKMRNDITDVVSGYVNLKRRGRNMVGLCPFHGEKTPSFNGHRHFCTWWPIHGRHVFSRKFQLRRTGC